MLHPLLVLIAAGSVAFGVLDYVRTSTRMRTPPASSDDTPLPQQERRLGLRDAVRAPLSYHQGMERRSVEAIFRALNEAGVRYLVVGGLAVIAHGRTRLTLDIDIVLDLDPNNARRALAALSGLKFRPKVPVALDAFADPDQREMWIRDKNMKVFSLLSLDHPMTEVDLFAREPFDFERAYALRFTDEVVPGVPATFVGLDHLLQLKKEAGRPKDLEDIRWLEHVNRERADD